jgi:hypothetical protein
MITTVTFDDGSTANVHQMHDSGAIYDFGDKGKIHAQHGYFRQPDRLAVTISLGRPGDQSGYGLTGLHVGDWYLTGTVMCTGLGFTPNPHPHSPKKNPLDAIDDADALAQAALLLSQIAQHFHAFAA